MKSEKIFRETCNQLVQALVGPTMCDAWWSSPNKAFDNRTPEEQWALGSDTVVNYLMHHAFCGGGS